MCCHFMKHCPFKCANIHCYGRFLITQAYVRPRGSRGLRERPATYKAEQNNEMQSPVRTSYFLLPHSQNPANVVSWPFCTLTFMPICTLPHFIFFSYYGRRGRVRSFRIFLRLQEGNACANDVLYRLCASHHRFSRACLFHTVARFGTGMYMRCRPTFNVCIFCLLLAFNM